ncbi:MAG: NAD-dependent epimerase/dehydratase family protein [Candidatus Omnitrophota bacterium]|nr:MAG: NAD-dependent epimerase/dehydratase family protein [Candidatus Omnitrophota bacterium]
MRKEYKRILITGGAGFIGSNLAVSLKSKYPAVEVIVLDNLKRRGSEFNVRRLKEMCVKFIHGDIRNPEDLEVSGKIDLLIECSAEPSVLSGYGKSPAYLINTNLVGTVNCLELARKNKADIIFLSTSRVYPYDLINNLDVIEEPTRLIWQSAQPQKLAGWSAEGIDVEFPLEGTRSMYGATKLCSEVILREYISMYGIHGVINRCSVVAGPGQFGKVDQGVFTLWMLAHYFKKPLSYIGFGGRGKQVRDLLHVNDLFDLVDKQIDSMDKVNGRIYNVGGGKNVSLSLLETTQVCEQISGNKVDIKPVQQMRPADIAIYITDNRRVYSDLGWQPKKSSCRILEDIYKWIQNNESVMADIE